MIESLILSILNQNENSLSSYQLQRKLKNMEQYELVSQIGNALKQLEANKMIYVDLAKGDEVAFYKISDLGLESLNGSVVD